MVKDQRGKCNIVPWLFNAASCIVFFVKILY